MEEISQQLVVAFMLFLPVVAALGLVMMMHRKMLKKRTRRSASRDVKRRPARRETTK